MTQRFDNLATKFVKFITMSAPPKGPAIYGTTDGGVAIAVNGVQIAKFGGTGGNQGAPVAVLAGDVAIPIVGGSYAITKGSAAALTLAAPTSGSQASGGQDGLRILVTSNTAFAHVITATGLLQTGATAVNTATFAAHAGATVELMAYGGKWNVVAANAVSFG